MMQFRGRKLKQLFNFKMLYALREKKKKKAIRIRFDFWKFPLTYYSFFLTNSVAL